MHGRSRHTAIYHSACQKPSKKRNFFIDTVRSTDTSEQHKINSQIAEWDVDG